MQRVRGNTYWMPTGSSNVGIVVFPNKDCVLIDAGGSPEEADAILATLAEKKLTPIALLITHVHGDNAGGAHTLRQKANLKVYAPVNEKLYLENPKAMAKIAPKGDVPLEDASFRSHQGCPCAGTLKPGTDWVAPNGKSFAIIDLAGHTAGQVGIVTPDQVCFSGDALASPDDLRHYFIPLLTDFGKGKETLQYLGQSPYSVFVPTHGPVYDFSLADEVGLNLAQLALLEQNVFLHLGAPMELSDLVAYVIASFNLPETMSILYRLHACLPSYLNELVKQKHLKSVHEGGKTRWFQAIQV